MLPGAVGRRVAEPLDAAGPTVARAVDEGVPRRVAWRRVAGLRRVVGGRLLRPGSHPPRAATRRSGEINSTPRTWWSGRGVREVLLISGRVRVVGATGPGQLACARSPSHKVPFVAISGPDMSMIDIRREGCPRPRQAPSGGGVYATIGEGDKRDLEQQGTSARGSGAGRSARPGRPGRLLPGSAAAPGRADGTAVRRSHPGSPGPPRAARPTKRGRGPGPARRRGPAGCRGSAWWCGSAGCRGSAWCCGSAGRRGPGWCRWNGRGRGQRRGRLGLRVGRRC